MVRLRGVSKWYFGDSRVLDQIHLEIARTEFLYLIGGSGAGKSSLLRIIATEEPPSEGSVSLFGYDLSTASPTTLRAIRRAVGYIPQNVRLIGDLSVYDNIALAVSLAGKRGLSSPERAKITELIDKLGLLPKRDQAASTLSGGEAQRVAVARALARSPELIIADEPTGAQDRDFTWLMMDLFLKANASGAGVIIATHDREIVRRVKRRSATLQGGRVAMEEPLCLF